MVAAAPSPRSANPAPPGSGTPTPSTPTQITTPEAFLRALICSNFDFPALAALVSPTLLLQFVKDPTVLAELESVTTLSNLCLDLRQAHFRAIALTALANLVQEAEDDPVERRRAATALLHATKPAAAAKPKAPAGTAQPGSPEPESPEEAEDADDEEETPTPRPTCTPSPALTVESVVKQIILAVENLDKPEENSGLATLAAFCDDDAELNDEPLPTDDVAECIDILADTHLAPIQGCQGRVDPQDLTISGDSATCAIKWSPSPAAACTTLKLTLKRAAFSRCAEAWLITATHPAPRGAGVPAVAQAAAWRFRMGPSRSVTRRRNRHRHSRS